MKNQNPNRMNLSLSKSPILSIQVYAARFPLDQSNKRVVKCRDCKKELLPGLAIKRELFRRNGFICIACFESHLRVATFAMGVTDQYGVQDNDAGFFIDPAFRVLRACVLGPRQFTTKEVSDSVRVALLEKAETTADFLLGEGIGPIRLGDVAEGIL